MEDSLSGLDQERKLLDKSRLDLLQVTVVVRS
jgi:hypothetical protein